MCLPKWLEEQEGGSDLDDGNAQVENGDDRAAALEDFVDNGGDGLIQA